MLKRIIFIFCITIIYRTASAQGNDGYFLIPGPQVTLPPGGQVTMYVKYAQPDGTPLDISDDDIVEWNVNGHALNALAPADGKMLFGDLILSKATYVAPSGVPEKNPIAISIKLKSRTGKGVTILVCNVTILKAQYKITMDAESTNEQAGGDIKLHGECYANLRALNDGTFMLEPVDKTRNMNVTVTKAFTINADGVVCRLITPLQYVFPFLFTIGKMDKNASGGHAVFYLNTTAPQSGIVKWITTSSDGSVTNITDIDKGTITYISPIGEQTIQPIPGGMMYAMDNMTNLNVLTGLMVDPQLIMQNVNQNITNAKDKMAFAQRLQAHENDPAYFKTAQGKADLQRAQASYQQLGGNITNTSDATKNSDAEIARKIKNNPGYAGSKQFQQDMAKANLNRVTDENIYQKPAMAQVTAGTAVIRIEGVFNAKGDANFQANKEASLSSLHSIVKISIRKVQ